MARSLSDISALSNDTNLYSVCVELHNLLLWDASKLPAPHSSELHNYTRTEYKFVSLLKVDMPLKDLAIWLGKCIIEVRVLNSAE